MPTIEPESSQNLHFKGRVKSHSSLIVVAVVVIDRESRALLCCRPVGRDYAGYWEFPGGKVEPGETPSEAAAREMKEELDISIDPADLTPITFVEPGRVDGPDVVLFLSCRRWAGVVNPMESQQVCWASTSTWSDLEFLPGNERAFPMLMDHIRACYIFDNGTFGD